MNSLSKLIKNNAIQNVIVFSKTLKKECENGFFNKNCKFTLYSDFLKNNKSWEVCKKEAVELLNKWKKIRINKKDVFKEILGYKNISFLDLNSIEYISVHSEYLAKIIYQISIINGILKNINSQSIVLLYPKTDWERLIKIIFSKYKTKIIDIGKLKDKIRLYLDHNFIDFKVEVNNIYFNLKYPLKFYPLFIKLKNLKRTIFQKKLLNKIKINDKNEIDLIFYIDNNKYLDMIHPLIKSIQKDNKYNSLVLSYRNDFKISSTLKKKRIPFKILDSYNSFEIIKKSTKLYFSIIRKYNKIKKNTWFKKNFFYINNLNLQKFLESKLEKSLYFSYFLIEIIHIMENISKIYEPKVFITTNIPLIISRTLLKVCEELEINKVGIERAIGGFISEFSLYEVVDKLLVAGNFAKDSFIKWGIQEDKIVITGIPIWDSLITKMSYKKEINNTIKQSLKINSEDIVVTYLTEAENPTFNYRDKVNEIKTIFSIIKEFDSIFLIIKLHPTEKKRGIYKRLADKNNLKKYHIIENNIPLEEILFTSDVALTKRSTTGFDALIAGCNLVILDFQEDHFIDNFYIKGGVADVVASKEELFMFLKRKLNNETIANKKEIVEDFLKYHIYKTDCNSIERIKNSIYEMFQ